MNILEISDQLKVRENTINKLIIVITDFELKILLKAELYYVNTMINYIDKYNKLPCIKS